MLLLNINRKAYMGQSIDAIICDFSDLQRFMSRSLTGVYLLKDLS